MYEATEAQREHTNNPAALGQTLGDKHWREAVVAKIGGFEARQARV